MIFDILFIRSKVFFQRYSDLYLRSWVILVNNSVLFSRYIYSFVVVNQPNISKGASKY